MSQKSSTPDERLMMQLYKIAMEKGNPHEIVPLRDAMGLLGQRETAVKNIVKHLAQANFLIKVDESSVSLTERGCAFVLDLLDQ